MRITSSFWRLLATLGCLPALAFAATPTITSVSGTVLQGQTLSIAGTSMVQEDKTNWDPFFTTTHPNASGFEGASLAADGYGTNSWGTAISYDTSVKLMGSKSVKTHGAGQYIRDAGGGGMFSPGYWWDVAASLPGTSWTDVFLRSYTRWNANSWPTEDVKYWRIQQGTHGYFFSLVTNADGSPPTQFRVFDNEAGDPIWKGNIPGGAIQNNRWYLFEGHFRIHGSGSYVAQLWIDNKLAINVTPSAGADPNPGGWGWESNTNMYNTPVGWSFDYWQDGFAVSRTRVGPASLIEIGNSSDYATATKVYQEPLFLSDGSSQFKVNLTGLGAGPYFLWVTNNNNPRERSQAFVLSSSTFPPPQNLRVQ